MISKMAIVTPSIETLSFAENKEILLLTFLCAVSNPLYPNVLAWK